MEHEKEITEDICACCSRWRTNRAIANLYGEGYGICDDEEMLEEITFCSHRCPFCDHKGEV